MISTKILQFWHLDLSAISFSLRCKPGGLEHTKTVNFPTFSVLRAQKIRPFWAELPRIADYREYFWGRKQSRQLRRPSPEYSQLFGAKKIFKIYSLCIFFPRRSMPATSCKTMTRQPEQRLHDVTTYFQKYRVRKGTVRNNFTHYLHFFSFSEKKNAFANRVLIYGACFNFCKVHLLLS